MRVCTIIIFGICSLCSFILHAQDYHQKDIDLSRLADELFAFQDADLNYEDLYENMVQLLSNPININRATAEELRFLNILSEAQIQNFMAYRNVTGNLLTVYELQAIPGFDLATIYKLVPFIKVPDASSAISTSILKRALQENNNYLIVRLETTLERKKGFEHEDDPNTKFKGENIKEYVRFRSSRPGDFSVGLTAEKDAGEQFNWDPSTNQYGFDYISFHAQIQNKGKLKNFIIGDYQNQFAQGLMLGGTFGLGKGSESITTTRKSNIGTMPFTSANEAGFLRGISFTYELTKSLYLTSFFSKTKRDATIARTDSVNEFITSLQTTGFHRNDNELQGRRKLRETNYGTVLNYRTKSIDAGAMLNAINFTNPIQHNPSAYNQFSMQGNKYQNVGLFFNYTFHNTTFFSEVSRSLHAGTGLLAGMISSLTNELDISMLYRKFDKDFQILYSNAFSENTMPQNESGIYWGWKYRFNRKFSFTGYLDFFQFPWLRFRSYSPSNGHEWLSRINYQPSKHVLIFLQAREENKARNQSENSSLYITRAGTKRNYSINADYGIGQTLKLKTRAQFSTYTINSKTTGGFVLLQDIGIGIGKFEFKARYALFDTDDYDNRQYVYEQDVWLAYSLPAYYGKGIRNYILMEYKISKSLSLWIRYARTKYINQDKIGAGQDAIDGNTRNDLKFQARFKF